MYTICSLFHSPVFQKIVLSLDFQIFFCKNTTEFHVECISVGECIPSVKMLFPVGQSITANVELY